MLARFFFIVLCASFLVGASFGQALADSYVNLRARELTVTFESTIVVDPEYRGMFATAQELMKFASTPLAKARPAPEWGWVLPGDNRPENMSLYLQIQAMDLIQKTQVTWQIDGDWVTTAEMEQIEQAGRLLFPVPFQVHQIKAVVDTPKPNSDSAAKVAEPTIEPGTSFATKVPRDPATLYHEIESDGAAHPRCASLHSEHIQLSRGIYWYVWSPDSTECPQERLQPATVIVEEVSPFNPPSYPEYDRLLEDDQLTVAMVMGKIGDGGVQQDLNWNAALAMVQELTARGFSVVAESSSDGTVKSLSRTIGQGEEALVVTVDLYFPDYVGGLSYASDRWNQVLRSHEVVIYSGHSLLGSGKAFSDAEYSDGYQIVMISSCLSYGYYVPDVLRNKGAANADVLSILVEQNPTWNDVATLTLVETLIAGVTDRYHRTSWQDILAAINKATGMSYFGVSGASDNVFQPPPVALRTFDSDQQLTIRDAEQDEWGWDVAVTSTSEPITIDDAALVIRTLEVTAGIDHPYLDHLSYVLLHEGPARSANIALYARDGKLLPSGLPAALSAQGEWRLSIIDSYNDEIWSLPASSGTLDGWSISIEPADDKADRLGTTGQVEQGGCAVAGSAIPPLWALLLIGLLLLRRR